MTRSNKGDVESGNNNQLYPMMLESPQLRWAFIRKVYSILCIQMLLTTAVAATVVFVRPIPNFFTQTAAGLAVYIVISTHLHTSFHTYLNFSLLFFSWNSLWDFCFCFWCHTCSWIWYSFTLFLCCFMICSFMALVLLPQASPLELLHSHAVYGFNLICGGTCLRIYKRYWIQFTSIFFFFSFYVKLNKDLYFLIAFFDEKKDVWIFI